MQEDVILVNEQNEVIGSMPKALVHHANTPLHRAFSVFIFNSENQLLLQQRSHLKIAFPLVWSNSCCGHPLPGESLDDAVRRRVHYELGLDLENSTVVLPHYRYRAEMLGIVENEFCPVLIAHTTQIPIPNKEEVEAIRWIPWNTWVQEVSSHPNEYSPWCVEETLLLDKHPIFK